jgi:alkylation response protein AidB-like acyl-CoA dehydrogenase
VAGPADDEAARWRDSFLNSFALSIGGGTPEIQRDIIATRLLGLARMPRP